MRKFLTLIAFSLLVSIPALAETTFTVEDGTSVKIQKSAPESSAVGSGAIGAAKVSLNAPVEKGKPVQATTLWTRSAGDQVRTVTTRQVGGHFAAVFVAEDGCPLLFKLKYPTLPCSHP